MGRTAELQKETLAKTAAHWMTEVRRRTRRQLTAEEKIRIVLEGLKREIAVSELCRREGLPAAAY